MKNIYLSLGSNVGNRAENIISALSFLKSSLFVNIKRVSSFYDTFPVGPKQRNFYNIVIKAQTNLGSSDLLLLIKQAELILGRKKTIKWGARVIDIDVLFFGKKIINTDSLIVPHREIENRLFVLIPLNEIAGDFVHPVLERKIADILLCSLKKMKKDSIDKACRRVACCKKMEVKNKKKIFSY
jgi:2-amino-4-hydroxy-6-hydroxymethyldihydropteridine diphosphokinase